MSKIALVSPASGTATFSIEAPVGSTDRTLTLPDSAGTLATAESTLTQFSASGSAPVFAARAWVNFNGTGTVAIRASGNVSSVTRSGSTGDYLINFTTAMPDTNYATVSQMGFTSGVGGMATIVSNPSSTTQAVVTIARQDTSGGIDASTVSFAVFR
jgi:hypothetical protein